MSNDGEPGQAPRAVAQVDEPEQPPNETVTEPAKVMRIGSMVKQLLEEVRAGALDEASRERLGEIYERSIVELSEALSPDLQDELHNLALPFKDGEIPSDGELASPRRSWSGGSRGCSTASRRRCSPSRSRPASSSSKCASYRPDPCREDPVGRCPRAPSMCPTGRARTCEQATTRILIGCESQ